MVSVDFRNPSLSAPAQALTLEEVHETHADFVWRSLQRLGVPRADLEDALQEVFLVVHRKLASFDGSARLTTWLFAIALRVAAGQRRKGHRQREALTPEALESEDASLTSNPERSAMARQAADRLERALEKLGLERRAVFVMYEIEGISAVEIAEMLDTPVGTIYSRLSAARAEFVRAVEKLDRRRGEP